MIIEYNYLLLILVVIISYIYIKTNNKLKNIFYFQHNKQFNNLDKVITDNIILFLYDIKKQNNILINQIEILEEILTNDKCNK